MLKMIYHFLDRVWQSVSNLVFLRFAFDFQTDTLVELAKTNRLVFALTHGGIIEWLILSSWSRKAGFGAILVANRKQILFFSKPLYFLQTFFLKKPFSDLFLSEEAGPRLIFCPAGERKELFRPTDTENLIAHLYQPAVEDSQKISFVFVPVFICWRKHTRGSSRQLGEYFFGLSSKPNFFGKLWYLVRKRGDSTVRNLAPITFASREAADVSDDLDGVDAHKMARMVRRRILVQVNQEMRVTLGPRFLSPYLIKENIMKDPELLKMVEDISIEKGFDRRKVMGEAYTYLSEIAANYTYRFIEVMYVLLTWLFGKIFEDIVILPSQIQALRETLKTKPCVLVSCHRSHLDYMVVPGVLFLQDIVTPHIAAGVNLSFWPVGHFLRMGGAFFIRRSFRGQQLYALCLQKYIDWLIKNRITLKFFIEGTRSRTGKMLPPAYGLLKMVLNSFQQGQVDDLALIPISISYDEVVEEGAYSKELSGGEKEKESTGGLVRSRKLFTKNFGKVYVRFAEGLSVKQEYSSATENQTDPHLALQKLAFHICKSINDVTPVTPKSILASVLLSHEASALALDEILRASLSLAQCAQWNKTELSCGNHPDELMRALEIHLRKLLASQILQVEQGTPNRYHTDPRKRINLVFYKNNSIHSFVLPSITLLALARAQEALEGSSGHLESSVHHHAMTLRNVLKFEFFFSPTAVFSKEVQESLALLLPSATQSHQGSAHKTDFLFPKREDLSVLLKLNQDIIQSYLIAFEILKTLDAGTFEQKELLQRAVRQAVECVEEGIGFKPECVSTQNFSNAFKLLENIGVLAATREESGRSLFAPQPLNKAFHELHQELLAFHRILNKPCTSLFR